MIDRFGSSTGSNPLKFLCLIPTALSTNPPFLSHRYPKSCHVFLADVETFYAIYSQSGIKDVSAVGAIWLGNHHWSWCTLRRRLIPCHRILGAHIVDHNLKQHGLLAAVEL